MARRSVVVGASSDIGAAIAEVFAERGDVLELWGRDPGRLEATAGRCAAAGSASAVVRVLDVRDRAALADTVAAVIDTGDDVAAMTWAAGVFQWGRFDKADPREIDAVLETSLTAPAAAARLFAPALVAAAPSHLVLIGSAAGRRAFASNAAHVAAKHGLRGLAEALHLDLSGLGVAVTLITAGIVDAGAGRDSPEAQAHPDRVLTPRDIAHAVRYATSSAPNARVTEISLQPAAM